MTTITSPDGRTHLIQTHPTIYRGVRTHTVTWCGIRATRGWATERVTPSTCGVCQRRQDAASGGTGAPDGDGEPGPGTADAVASARRRDSDGETRISHGDTGRRDTIWSRATPAQRPPDEDIWSRPSPRPTATGNTFVRDDG